jgi:hypothetical protein
LLLSISTGWANDNPAKAPPGSRVSDDEAGIMFGSIGATSPSFESSAFRYRQLGRRFSGAVSWEDKTWFRKLAPADFTVGQYNIALFFARLPPGNYEIFQVSFREHSTGVAATSFSAKKEFSIPFTIEKGRATYLGQFIVHVQTGPAPGPFAGGPYGPRTGGGYFVVHDELQRDTEALKDRLGVESLDVGAMQQRVSTYGIPFFVDP